MRRLRRARPRPTALLEPAGSRETLGARGVGPTESRPRVAPLVVFQSAARSAVVIGWRAGPVCFGAASRGASDEVFPVATWKAGRAKDWVKPSVRQAAEPVCTGLSSAAKRRDAGRGGAGPASALSLLGGCGRFCLLVTGVSCVGLSADCHLGNRVGVPQCHGGDWVRQEHRLRFLP